MIAFSRTDDHLLADWWWTVDRALLAAIGLLSVMGLIFLLAASPTVARINGLPEWHFAVRQMEFLLAAALILLAASMVNEIGVVRGSVLVLVLSLVIMAALPMIGEQVNGARRWVSIAGISLQPSEFAKPALIVVTAWLLTRRPWPRGVIEAGGLAALVLALLIAQPDVGMALLVGALFATLLFLGGLAWLWVGLLSGLVACLASFAFLSFAHVRSRVLAFLSDEQPFQVMRSLKAIEAGGWLGRGPGEGRVKLRLPDSHADFVFAAGVEDYGVAVGLIMIALFAFIVLRGLYQASFQSSEFARLAAAGLMVQIGLQAVINVGVNLSLLPAKGMTLPLVSYGGSSLFATALTFGMALALIRRRRKPIVVSGMPVGASL
ncbi:MAG: FtsW/RodA/SpoVE family cell cycle protein [Geminicoccaceae bacterium]